MPYRLCPKCRDPGRWVESASKGAFVDYFRCEHCEHVWGHRKNDPTPTTFDVTIPATGDKA